MNRGDKVWRVVEHRGELRAILFTVVVMGERRARLVPEDAEFALWHSVCGRPGMIGNLFFETEREAWRSYAECERGYAEQRRIEAARHDARAEIAEARARE